MKFFNIPDRKSLLGVFTERRLDQQDLVWFNELKNQFKGLSAAIEETSPRCKVAKEIVSTFIDAKSEDITAQRLADLETWIIELLPVEDLRQKVGSLRDEYAEMVGDEYWNRLLPQLIPQVATADEKALRAEARRLSQDLHWLSSIQPEAQSIRLRLMIGVALTSLGVVLVGFLAILRFGTLTLSYVIVVAGVLGAFISCIQRIQSAELCSSRATNLAKNDKLVFGVAISPMLGSIFAVILVMLLLTQEVNPGFVIPAVRVCSIADCEGSTASESVGAEGNAATNIVQKASKSDGPKTSATVLGTNSSVESANAVSRSEPQKPGLESRTYDFFGFMLLFTSAKDLVLLIVWAFVAGFSERLVPDMLTRLANTKRG